MASLDIVDILVLLTILSATVAYFTKGTLWAKPEEDKYSLGLGGAGFSSQSGSSRDILKALESNNKNVIVFYGSQTGTAEDYASRLAKEASSRFGLKTMTADIEDYDFENLDALPSDKVICFVMATYGEGEPTDSAVEFWQFITSEDSEFSKGGDTSSSPLSDLNYVLFGLGNNTYEFYNQIGRTLDKTLQNLGAHRIGPYGEGDDGDATMEEDYLEWKDNLFDAWKEQMGLEEHEAVYEPSIAVSEDGTLDDHEQPDTVFLGESNKAHLDGTIKGPFSASNPLLAPATTTKELFKSDSRNCIHLEVDISGTGLRYNTGDHLALLAQNSVQEVDRFLEVFGLSAKRNSVINVKTLDPTAKIPFPVPTTYETVVRFYLEINGPVSRQLLFSIAPFAPSEQAKKEATRLGSDKTAFATEIHSKFFNIAQTLSHISGGEPWDKVPFSFIIESVNHLVPRYYSISSSSLVDKGLVSITAVVESVKPEGSNHVLKGVATNYILDLKYTKEGKTNPDPSAVNYNVNGPRGLYEGNKIPIYIRHSNFKLPSNPQKPIIMVGPGTGVAPFRGFIHERAHQAKQGVPIGPALLFFGSRTSTEDYLYSDEWVNFQADNDNPEYPAQLNESNFLKVKTAFSREGPTKVYVQHRMEENAKIINDLLKDGAYFYVCGDASRMARDVQNTLTKIIASQRDIPIEKAQDIVKNMKTQNSYQEDVW